jgi:PAS domain S-box-containing protein
MELDEKYIATGKLCRDKYACLFENNSSIMLLLNAETGEILNANAAACKFYGYSKNEFLNINIFTIAQIKDMSAFEYEYSEQSHKLENGDVRYVEVTSGKIPWDEENIVCCTINDVSEKKRIREYLRENQEKYRTLIELSPDAIFILSKERFIFSNYRGLEMLHMSSIYDLLEKSIREILNFNEEDTRKLFKIMDDVVNDNKIIRTIEYELTTLANEDLYLEIDAAPLEYMEQKLVQMVVRDITEQKKELIRAYKLQKRRVSFEFPIDNFAKMDSVYIPAKTLSGDYFSIKKVSETTAIGAIGDVAGHGVVAALNISALNVLFNDAILMNREPLKIIDYMNTQMRRHFDDEYIAACCFSFDFKNKILKAAGAGINQFVYLKNGVEWNTIEVKGTFLGMFNENFSEEISIQFNQGDKFFFYTDGMDFIFDDKIFRDNIIKLNSITKIKRYIKSILTNIKDIQDDCSWFAIEVK